MSNHERVRVPTQEIQLQFLVHAPQDLVFQQWMEFVWENNCNIPLKPSLQRRTKSDYNIGSYHKNERRFMCSMLIETITNINQNKQVDYKVESPILPFNNYSGTCTFQKYHNFENVTLVMVNIRWQCGFGYKNKLLCCSTTVLFCKQSWKYTIDMMSKQFTAHVEEMYHKECVDL